MHPYQLVGQLKYTRMITNLPESLKVFKDAQRRDPRRFSMPDTRKSFYGDMMRHNQAIDELPEDVEPGGEYNEDDDGVIVDSPPSIQEKKSLLERLYAWFEGLAHVVDRYNIKSHGGAVNFGVGDGGDDTQMTRALTTHAHSARAIQRLARYCIGVIDVNNSSTMALRRKLTTKPDPSRKIFKRYMLTSKTTLTSNLASRPVRRFTFKPCTAVGKSNKTRRNSAKKMFMPGDFIEIQCAVEGQVLTRSYTPIEGNMDEEFAIYVKIYPDGMVSRFLVSCLIFHLLPVQISLLFFVSYTNHPFVSLNVYRIHNTQDTRSASEDRLTSPRSMATTPVAVWTHQNSEKAVDCCSILCATTGAGTSS